MIDTTNSNVNMIAMTTTKEKMYRAKHILVWMSFVFVVSFDGMFLAHIAGTASIARQCSLR